MATKKSTPKKTNTTRAPRGEAQRSTKSKTSTVASTAKKAFDEGIREITGAKASAARSAARSAATSGAKGRTIEQVTHKQKTQTRNTGAKTSTPKSSARANVGDAYIARDGVRNTLTGELMSKQKSSNASIARGQRLNSSASMPKGEGSRVDARVTTPAAARSRGANTRRFYPVDRIIGGTNGGFAIPEDKYKVPEGASNVRYDSYKDKYVPVFTSGDKKKNSKKDLPRDYGL